MAIGRRPEHEDERVVVDGHALECRSVGTRASRPPLVFLHEGLGSVELWRDVPEQLVEATERQGFVYSRAGYGRSDPAPLPRPVEYMHHEALVVLPALLARLGIRRPVLVGHSDGASIALIATGAGTVAPSGLVLLAPHVFVEDRSIAGIEAARIAYTSTDLGRRMAKYHDDPDATFWGWNDVWLSPAFRAWNIEGSLGGVTCPVLVVQGDADEYGSLAQVDAIEAGVSGPVERLVVPGSGHAPHLERPDVTVAAITRFCSELSGSPP
jgi:pimeloyl-ACP methyl ester carboxylesterase